VVASLEEWVAYLEQGDASLEEWVAFLKQGDGPLAEGHASLDEGHRFRVAVTAAIEHVDIFPLEGVAPHDEVDASLDEVDASSVLDSASSARFRCSLAWKRSRNSAALRSFPPMPQGLDIASNSTPIIAIKTLRFRWIVSTVGALAR
jgi:hypothetical protein